jgi:hypothetical protein
MEHRHRPRLPGRLPIRLWHRGGWLGPFLTRDLTPDGLFLITGPLKLHRSQWLQLSMVGSGVGRSMAGMLVHQSPAGIGVMLVKRDPRYVQALLELGALAAEQPVWVEVLSRAAGL